jgi:hypothetical protein
MDRDWRCSRRLRLLRPADASGVGANRPDDRVRLPGRRADRRGPTPVVGARGDVDRRRVGRASLERHEVARLPRRAADASARRVEDGGGLWGMGQAGPRSAQPPTAATKPIGCGFALRRDHLLDQVAPAIQHNRGRHGSAGPGRLAGYHVRLDGRRLVLPGRHPRPILAGRLGLGAGRNAVDRPAPARGSPASGSSPSSSRARIAASLRSWLPVHERALPPGPRCRRHRGQHERRRILRGGEV